MLLDFKLGGYIVGILVGVEVALFDSEFWRFGLGLWAYSGLRFWGPGALLRALTSQCSTAAMDELRGAQYDFTYELYSATSILWDVSPLHEQSLIGIIIEGTIIPIKDC